MGTSHSRKRNGSIKFAVMGAGRVGKTALVTRFLSNHFVSVYDPTVEDNYQTHIQGVDEKEATLAIFQDIGGHSNFSTLRESYMKYNKSFILVYSVTSKASFEEIRSFYEQIQKVKSEDVPIGILIGNKSDLESEREVSTIEGENLGSSLHLPFLETSALLKTNVEEMFQLIVSHTIRGVTNQFRNIKSARQ